MKDIHIDVKGQTEDALQQKCIFWFWNTYPHYRRLLFSVPNGGLRDGKTAKTMNLTGLTKGVSDLILLKNNRAYLLEAKKDKKASQSKEQKSWQALVEREGFNYQIFRSLHEFKVIIMQIMLK